MSELHFPTAWLRIDEAAVALGVALDAAVMYSKTDYWRTADDEHGVPVFALEDVRATAGTLTTAAHTIIVPERKLDRRYGARPSWPFRLRRHP